jgi:hypothetical protein
LKDRWREQGLVKRRDLSRYMERSDRDIRWALETDDND